MKVGEGGETKRNDKMQLPQKVLCGNIYRTNNAPKWTSGKAESCDWTVLYMAELKLDWTGLELYVTLHWAIGNSFFFSRSRRAQTAIVVNLMHPRVERVEWE